MLAQYYGRRSVAGRHGRRAGRCRRRGSRCSPSALTSSGSWRSAALSGYLAEGLRRADAQLEQASNQLADLQAFSQHVIDSLTSGLATTDIEGGS